MNKNIVPLLFSIVLLAVSCKKENSEIPVATLKVTNLTSDTTRLLVTINGDTIAWGGSIYGTTSNQTVIEASISNQIVVKDTRTNSTILSTALSGFSRNDKIFAFILDNIGSASMSTTNLNTELPNDTAIGAKFANFSFNAPSVFFTVDGDTVATGLDFKAVSSNFYFSDEYTHTVRAYRESDGTLLKAKALNFDKGSTNIIYLKGDVDINSGNYKFDIDKKN